jgi:maltose O-acetyltransferase
MPTEREKMLAGELYDASDPELVQMCRRARQLLQTFNASLDAARERRVAVLRGLLGAAGAGVHIEPPFYCDYGTNILLEEDVYLNFNCVVLDCNLVRIGAGTLIGPAVQIYAAYHPLDAGERAQGPELAAPVTIGRRVWIGGGAIILPGRTIGDNSTLGAGSVVTKDIPANVFAAGNPARVIRDLKPPD